MFGTNAFVVLDGVGFVLHISNKGLGIFGNQTKAGLRAMCQMDVSNFISVVSNHLPQRILLEDLILLFNNVHVSSIHHRAYHWWQEHIIISSVNGLTELLPRRGLS